jgi:hypothetical protein
MILRRFLSQAPTQFGSLLLMTDQAQRPKIRKVALSAAFRNGDDVVRIPKAFAAHTFQAPACQQPLPLPRSRALQLEISRVSVDPANLAHAPVPAKHLFTEIAGIRAEPPLMHTPIGAKRKSAAGNFQTAPAAKRSAVRPGFETITLCGAAGHCAGGAHSERRAIEQLLDHLFYTKRLARPQPNPSRLVRAGILLRYRYTFLYIS